MESCLSSKSKPDKGSAGFSTYKQPQETDMELEEFIPNPEWLQVKFVRVLDEFIDVNEGEKEFMKIWNLHLLTYRSVSDCQLPLVCKRFVERRGEEIIKKNLCRNFCLHLTNLFDFGLLTCQGVHGIMEEFKGIAQRLENENLVQQVVYQMGPPVMCVSSRKISKNSPKTNVKSQVQQPLRTASLKQVKVDGSVIAIDFGMTYSRVAVLQDDNQVKIIENSFGEEATLSYLTFNANGVTDVGLPVNPSYPEDTICALKCIVGQSMADVILQRQTIAWPFKLVEGESGPLVEVNGTKMAPEVVLAMFFQELKTQAEKYLNMPVMKAIITVPLHYNDRQKAATLKAGKLAGFEQCSLLCEPIAAAIAYKRQGLRKNARKLLVFDMGHCTVDLTILEVDHRNGSFEVLHVDCDHQLGSVDLDINMTKYCGEEFQRQYGVNAFDDMDPRDGDTAIQRYRRVQKRCREAKMNFIMKSSIFIDFSSFFRGNGLSVCITRKIFKEINAAVFQRIITVVDRALKTAAIRKGEIDDILLVGGTTRIPTIHNMLRQYFNGKALNHSVPPECAVVYGAAIHSATL